MDFIIAMINFGTTIRVIDPFDGRKEMVLKPISLNIAASSKVVLTCENLNDMAHAPRVTVDLDGRTAESKGVWLATVLDGARSGLQFVLPGSGFDWDVPFNSASEPDVLLSTITGDYDFATWRTYQYADKKHSLRSKADV